MKAKLMLLPVVVVIVAALSSPTLSRQAFAADAGHADTHSAASAGASATRPAHHADHYPAYAHPTLPASHELWPGVMLLIVIAMFFAAAVIGIVVDLNLPDEPPPPAHDEHRHDDHAHGGHAHH
jgi:hypothetical protein